MRRKNEPKPSAASKRQRNAGGDSAHGFRLPCDERDADESERDPGELDRLGALAAHEADDDRQHGGGRGDRRDDADRADRHAAVERTEPERAGCARGNRGEQRDPAEELLPGERRDDEDPGETGRLRDREHRERRESPRGDAAEEVADSPEHARPEGERNRGHSAATGRVAATASSWFTW